MNPFARLLGVGVLGFAGFGLFQVVTDPPDIHLALPSLSLPAMDDRPQLTVNPGMRLTFDEPTGWDVPSSMTAAVWWCEGGYDVIEGPANLQNVCALALYWK